MVEIDHLEAEAFSALGASPIVWVDVHEPGADGRARRFAGATQAVIGGLDRRGTCPPVDLASFDLLFTAHRDPPAPWVFVRGVDQASAAISSAVARAPVAATICAQVLRAGAGLPFVDALTIESLGYSTLLGGAEFGTWLASRAAGAVAAQIEPFIRVGRKDDVVTITLTRPESRNAICAGMRDALYEALCAVLDDPRAPRVVLRGEGRAFSTGGALAEFGSATELAGAHVIRTGRSSARLLHELGDRATVRLQGACIGAGIEIAAAAAHRHAMPDAYFQLPELRMGLIPGAGGTVSLARAIGRHRTCYMVLSGRRVPRDMAVRWGLVTPVPA